MSAPGNKLLAGFLGFSVVFFAVALLTGNEAPVDPDPETRQEASGGVPASGDAPAMRGSTPGMRAEATDSDVVAGPGAGVDSDVSAGAAVPVTPASASTASTTSAAPRGDHPTSESRGDHPALDSYDFEEPARHLKLPKRLREISGLAMLAENRLLAHDDEKGTVVEIDYRDGSVVKDFKLGGPRGRVADDFEGIAAADGRLYLVSSSGRLYEFGEGADGATVSYSRHETGVGRFHEIEGLAYDPDQRALLLVSKNPRNKEQEGSIAIYRWSLDTRRLVEGGSILIEVSELAHTIDKRNFQPSGIERHPVSGNYFVVAARQRAVAEITPRGTVLAVNALKAGRHRQAEGISFDSDNTMIIADEGAGKRATLSFYPVAKGR